MCPFSIALLGFIKTHYARAVFLWPPQYLFMLKNDLHDLSTDILKNKIK